MSCVMGNGVFIGGDCLLDVKSFYCVCRIGNCLRRIVFCKWSLSFFVE